MDSLLLSHEWVLLLDADEALKPELAHEIRRAIQDPNCNGYCLGLQMLFLGRRLRHFGARFWKLSLCFAAVGAFRVSLERSGHCRVHEHVVDGHVAKLRNPVIHHNVESSHAISQAQRVFRLGGKGLAEPGDPA